MVIHQISAERTASFTLPSSVEVIRTPIPTQKLQPREELMQQKCRHETLVKERLAATNISIKESKASITEDHESSSEPISHPRLTA